MDLSSNGKVYSETNMPSNLEEHHSVIQNMLHLDQMYASFLNNFRLFQMPSHYVSLDFKAQPDQRTLLLPNKE